jgi:hypothetical protein
MRLHTQLREVLPNIAASLRSDNGLPVPRLVRYATTAAHWQRLHCLRMCRRPGADVERSAVVWPAAWHAWRMS